jgi:hypothetical protein
MSATFTAALTGLRVGGAASKILRAVEKQPLIFVYSLKRI